VPFAKVDVVPIRSLPLTHCWRLLRILPPVVSRKRASLVLPQSGAPTPEPRVDKPGFPRGTVRGGLQVQVPNPTQAETPQVRIGKAGSVYMVAPNNLPSLNSHPRFRCPLVRTCKT